jgi:hypothetical protein
MKPPLECPDCGHFYRGLGAHRGSTPCQVQARRRELRAAGLERTVRVAKLLDAGWPVVRAKTGYQPGSRNHRGRVTEQTWVPELAALLVHRASGLDALPYTDAVRRLRAVWELPEGVKRALLATYLLGGRPALQDALAAEVPGWGDPPRHRTEAEFLMQANV